jgi:peptidyl-prolyl cis-trans isomerase A (cyclophilin A)
MLLLRAWVIAVAVISASAWVETAEATIVRFETSLGNIDVRLYDSATPLNVANLLNYINANRYDGTFIHRSIPGFVIQGGGYFYDVPSNSAPHIQQFAQVMNEPGISNLRGTIAMAKLPPPEEGGPLNGGPNSATSEWFFNLSDSNASNLDFQNGGFTVFGRVVGNGMSVVDAIAALPRFDIDAPPAQTFDTVPLRDGSGLANRLVFINDAIVLNLPAGDYDFNGAVNVTDYTIWKSSVGSTTNASADGNGNGVIDAADYVLWRNTLTGGSGTFFGAVPEPGSVVLSLAAGLLFLFVRCRRFRS